MGNIVTEKKQFSIFNYKIIFKESYVTYYIVLFLFCLFSKQEKKKKKNMSLFVLFIDINNKIISEIQGEGFNHPYNSITDIAMTLPF